MPNPNPPCVDFLSASGLFSTYYRTEACVAFITAIKSEQTNVPTQNVQVERIRAKLFARFRGLRSGEFPLVILAFSYMSYTIFIFTCILTFNNRFLSIVVRSKYLHPYAQRRFLSIVVRSKISLSL